MIESKPEPESPTAPSSADLAVAIGDRLWSYHVLSKPNAKNRVRVKCDCGEERLLTAADAGAGVFEACAALPERKGTLVGTMHGRFKVTAFGTVDPVDKRSRIVCRCRCGSSKLMHTADVISGNTKSCGCLLRKQQALYAAARPSAGQRVLTLLVLEVFNDARTKHCSARCRCDCSAIFMLQMYRLTRGLVAHRGCPLYIVKPGESIRPPSIQLGDRFGNLVVMSLEPSRSRAYCRCSCGRPKRWLYSALRSGAAIDCGNKCHADSEAARVPRTRDPKKLVPVSTVSLRS